MSPESPVPAHGGPWRAALAIIAAVATAIALLVAVEAFGAAVHPFPAGFGGTHDEVCAHVARYPAWVLAAVIPMWGGAAMLTSWVARRVGRGRIAPGVAGGLLVAALGFNLAMLPYPWWFRAGAFVAVAGGAWLGGRPWGRA